MKRINLLFIVALLSACSSTPSKNNESANSEANSNQPLLFDQSNHTDKLHGIYTTYHPNGMIESKTTWKRGELNGTTLLFYPNGQLLSKANYQSGKLHGTLTGYYTVEESKTETSQHTLAKNTYRKTYNIEDGNYEIGAVKFEIPWQHNQTDGIAKAYYPNGQLQSIEPYQAGKLHGTLSYFSDTGQLIKLLGFANNEAIKGISTSFIALHSYQSKSLPTELASLADIVWGNYLKQGTMAVSLQQQQVTVLTSSITTAPNQPPSILFNLEGITHNTCNQVNSSYEDITFTVNGEKLQATRWCKEQSWVHFAPKTADVERLIELLKTHQKHVTIEVNKQQFLLPTTGFEQMWQRL